MSSRLSRQAVELVLIELVFRPVKLKVFVELLCWGRVTQQISTEYRRKVSIESQRSNQSFKLQTCIYGYMLSHSVQTSQAEGVHRATVFRPVNLDTCICRVTAFRPVNRGTCIYKLTVFRPVNMDTCIYRFIVFRPVNLYTCIYKLTVFRPVNLYTCIYKLTVFRPVSLQINIYKLTVFRPVSM